MSSTNKKIETGLVELLENDAAFDAVSIYAHHSVELASDTHPTIIVHCPAAPRDGDSPLEMNVYQPAIKAQLYWDTVDGDSADIETALENVFQDLVTMKAIFNYDGAPDNRVVTGIHLHYIESTTSDSVTDGTIKMFTVEAGLFVELVAL